MMRFFPGAAFVLALAPLCGAQTSQNEELFEMRIRPLLANKCYACHTEERMGGLQLDSREHALKGGKSGPVIVPGDPEKSLLVKALHYTDAKLKMPPTGKLKEDEIAAVATWIKNGAVWPASSSASTPKSVYKITPEQRKFWAFQPIGNPSVPKVRDTKWAKSDIDRFVLSALEKQSLKPVHPADKRTLIRRATFDLTGLPPTAQEVEDFLHDSSPNAFAKVVDRLLASPHYGERWGRIWLDVARYSDDKLDSERDNPYENSFRYRDWAIQAIQDDMPYDQFVKAQIAGDLLPESEKYRAGLGFYALSPEFQDDRVDATTRGFLGLTVACAQCHDHKYDPIPTQDYYSIFGIFNNTKLEEAPLAPKETVEDYEIKKKLADDQEAALKKFVAEQAQQLSEILAAQTSQYLMATALLDKAAAEQQIAQVARERNLDAETLGKWSKYISKSSREHPFLKSWDAARSQHAAEVDFKKIADDFQHSLLSINAEKKKVDDENHIRLGLNPSRKDLSSADLVSLARDKYVLWEEVFGKKGVLYYDDPKIDRFLSGVWREHLHELRARFASLKKEIPPRYPFLQTIADKPEKAEQKVWIRGSRDNPGEPAPPHFLAILSPGEPKRFTKGSGRLELAEAIVNPENPLTARVIVNRVWQQHFGQGIVRTPSNFGLQGDLPSHPELLDYLARNFMAEGWSFKKLHRKLMLSAAYALSAENSDKNYAVDPDNRMLWRANLRRLDAESLRDSLLFVAGKLDPKMGGPAVPLSNENHRRTVYAFVSRRRLDPALALFDFPNPVATSEQRIQTTVPLQKLFFLNSDFVLSQSKELADRLSKFGSSDSERLAGAYRLLFQREPSAEERSLGLRFLQEANHSWAQYAQVLLSSNEFCYLN